MEVSIELQVFLIFLILFHSLCLSGFSIEYDLCI